MDPRTGFPSKSGLVSVTLVGEQGAALDALATAALILGTERTAPLLTREGIDAIFVTDRGRGKGKGSNGDTNGQNRPDSGNRGQNVPGRKAKRKGGKNRG